MHEHFLQKNFPIYSKSKRPATQYCLRGEGGGKCSKVKRTNRTATSIHFAWGAIAPNGWPPTSRPPYSSLQFYISHSLYLCAGGQLFFIIHHQWTLYTQGTTVIKSGHVMVLKTVEVGTNCTWSCRVPPGITSLWSNWYLLSLKYMRM